MRSNPPEAGERPVSGRMNGRSASGPGDHHRDVQGTLTRLTLTWLRTVTATVPGRAHRAEHRERGVRDMLDPTSVAAISAVLGAVGSGMANEAGKWAWESTGAAVRRITGREVPAPVAPEERDDVARMVHERLRADPQL